MNKVVTINLGGNAYQLEEPAYDALRAYLNDADAKLAGNPDKEEIGKDLEQAIGSKCDAYVNAHKTVVTLAEVEAVLKEMGPVDGEGSEGAQGSSSSSAQGAHSGAPKRLYRIEEGRIIFGVATGLAAYFNVDVSLVRLLFIVLLLITGGGFAFAYFLAMVFIPEADTPAQKAEAYGTGPVTAQQLVERATESFNQLKKQFSGPEWQDWKAQMRTHKNQWKQHHKMYKQYAKHQGRAWQDSYKYEKAYTYKRTFLSELNEFIWSMFGLVVVSFFIWIVYHHVPEVHAFLDTLKNLFEEGVYTIYTFIQGNSH